MSRNTLYTAVAFALLAGYWWLHRQQDATPTPASDAAPEASVAAPAPPIAAAREVSRAVDAFDTIVMQCRMDLEVTTGGSAPLVLDAAGDNLDVVRTDVANGALTVTCGRGPHGAIDGTMHVRVPVLKAIRAFNAGKITIIGLSAEPFQVVRSVAGFAIDFSDDGDLVMENGAGTVELSTSRPLKANVFGAGHVIVHMSDADKLDAFVHGAGDVTATGHVKQLTANVSGGRLHLGELDADDATVSSSSSADSEVQANHSLSASINGQGQLTATGHVEQLRLLLRSGRARFADLAAEDAQVVIDGGGTAEVNVSHSLDASVRGAGHVIYDGNPASVTPHVQGSGDVKPRDQASLQDAPTVKLAPLYPVWNSMIGLAVQS